jgi:hypothetical protein
VANEIVVQHSLGQPSVNWTYRQQGGVWRLWYPPRDDHDGSFASTGLESDQIASLVARIADLEQQLAAKSGGR